MVKAVFFGTPEIACPSLEALAQSGIANVSAVVSQPDRPSGRDMKVHPTPAKELALKLDIPVIQPERARNEAFLAEIRAIAPDVIVVMAYGQILPPALLEIPRHGCVNIHTSILPKYRGAAPMQWALLEGEIETGVTLMKMDAGMDTGPIIAISRTPITEDDNAQTVHDRLALLGATLLMEKLPEYLNGSLQPKPQPAGATHARKITREDGRLNWREPAQTLWNRVRGLTPWPGTFTFIPAEPKPIMLKVWKAKPANGSAGPGKVIGVDKERIVVACGTGALELLELQREGGKRLAARDFVPGCPIRVGQRLE